MKLIKPFLLSLIVAISMEACGPNISDEQMAELSLLDSRLDSLSEQVNTIDSSKFMNYTKTFEKNIEFLQYDIKDTIPLETAFIVDEYYGLRKGLRKYSAEYPALKREVSTTKDQLYNLRNDVENGLIEPEQFNEYLKLEKENIDQIQSVSEVMKPKLQIAMPLFEEKNPQIDSIIQVYKAKQMNQ
jgi:hypothetical protein